MNGYGIQLYSVRDAMGESVEKTLKLVAEMGYSSVETAGFFDLSATEFKAILDKDGLTLSGTHSSWLDLKNNLDETIAFHKELGNKRYIVPGANFSTNEKLDAFIELVNEVQPKLEAEGITLHFHNHDSEFRPNSEGMIPFDELRKRTNIGFEIDVYWAYRAGVDPVKLIDELKTRVTVVHLKDGTMERGFSLGLGTAPIKEVIAYCRANNIDMVVESEEQEPDGISEIKRCIDYLKTI